MDNISCNDFKNICRTCMLTCDVKFPQDHIILEVYYNLTGVHFETNNDLPQQICQKCFEKINEIHKFALQCKQTQSNLTKCLNNETNEVIKIKEEITVDENNIEFVKVDNYFEENSKNEEIEMKPEIIEEATTSRKSKKYTCDICDKAFIYLTSFKRHKSMHQGELPYQCDICNKAFFDASTLSNHKVTHNPFEISQDLIHHDDIDRPYACDICTKTFKTSSHLIEHRKTHSGERPFECDICKKRFTSNSILGNHKATHSNDRPFQCDVCSKTFKLSSHLIIHLRVHSGERPYECDICHKSFKCSSHLIKHKRIHVGARPFQCDICHRNFSELSNLKSHKKRHEQKI